MHTLPDQDPPPKKNKKQKQKNIHLVGIKFLIVTVNQKKINLRGSKLKEWSQFTPIWEEYLVQAFMKIFQPRVSIYGLSFLTLRLFVVFALIFLNFL